MPYEVEAEHDLSDLSESEVYEGVLQLAAERQLLQGVVDDADEAGQSGSEVEVELFSIEPQAVVPREKASSKGISKVKQTRQELKQEKETYRELRCSRRRRIAQISSEDEEETGDETSDDERVDRRAKRQRHVVQQKEAELQRVLAAASIEQRIQREQVQAERERRRVQAQVQKEHRQAWQVRLLDDRIQRRLEAQAKKEQKEARQQRLREIRAERERHWQPTEEEETHSDSFDSGVDMDRASSMSY
jgi:ATP-dependent Lon protease